MKFSHQTVALIGLLVAGCGGGSGSTPAPSNAAPTISAIADQNTSANGKSDAIVFSVSDEQTSDLSVSAISDRQNVVPDASLVLGGSGTSRSLTVTPVIDTLGDAYITIIVTDPAGLSAGSTFLLTVDPVQRSMREFVRSSFSASQVSDPSLINAVVFDQDAGSDDFADLLAK